MAKETYRMAGHIEKHGRWNNESIVQRNAKRLRGSVTNMFESKAEHRTAQKKSGSDNGIGITYK